MLILALIAVVAIAALTGYAYGLRRRQLPAGTPTGSTVTGAVDPAGAFSGPDAERIGAEKARIIRGGESEAAHLRQALADADAIRYQAAVFGEDRRRLFAALADVRGDNARYRQLVIDIENNAPPPILSGAAGPDDLKLIVQQIAHWSERDIDEFDARLPEFPGRIRRDQWVTQARSLQQAKYGDGAAGLRPDGRRP
jgi:hypothetical protein